MWQFTPRYKHCEPEACDTKEETWVIACPRGANTPAVQYEDSTEAQKLENASQNQVAYQCWDYYLKNAATKLSTVFTSEVLQWLSILISPVHTRGCLGELLYTQSSTQTCDFGAIGENFNEVKILRKAMYPLPSLEN